MRRQVPVPNVLYNYLYPHPTPSDPPSFSAFLARCLVPEVRIEVATFYGDLNSTEARYPGLNYCHPSHRMRLGRFKHHKRLFEAFDTLGLTYQEIQDFCCWEGTKWARERYEKDEGIKVLDTTGDEIGPWIDTDEARAADEFRRHSITRKTDISVVVEETGNRPGRSLAPAPQEDEEMEDEEEDEEEETESNADGLVAETPEETAARAQFVRDLMLRREQAISQRVLRAALENRQDLTPEQEQFLKEQMEQNGMSDVPGRRRQNRSRTANGVPGDARTAGVGVRPVA